MSSKKNKAIKNNIYNYIYGYHSCLSALKNNHRCCIEVFLLEKNITKYSDIYAICKTKSIKMNIIYSEKDIPLKFKECIHQGILIKAKTLQRIKVNSIVNKKNEHSLVIALDNITDPHNIGAILRTAAVFAVDAVLIQKNISYDTSTVAKVSSGALDVVKIIQTPNIKYEIDFLKKHNYACYAIESSGSTNCNKTIFEKKTVLILGAENKGIRNSIIDMCDECVSIPTSNKLQSLNVSNAAAITMYEYIKQNIFLLK